MKKGMSVWILMVSLGLIFIMAVFGCSLTKENEPEEPGVIPLSGEYVGTFAFGGKSGTVYLDLSGSEDSEAAFNIKTIFEGILGFIEYDDEVFYIRGTYDDETGDITGIATADESDDTFEIIGRLVGDKFTGEITLIIDGESETGTISASLTTVDEDIAIYLGTYGSMGDPTLWGTFNLVNANGTLTGTGSGLSGGS